MKKNFKKMMFGLTFLLSMQSSFATSYWWDECEEEKLALNMTQEIYPELSLNGSCTRTYKLGELNSRNNKIEMCETTYIKLNWLKNKASFYVTILDPKTEKLVNFKVKMKTTKNNVCQLVNITELK